METYYKAINWNAIEDVIDKSTWEKLTEQFWLDTRIPLSNDLDDWRKLSNKEKDLVGKVFGGLTLLDTMQSETGVQALRACQFHLLHRSDSLQNPASSAKNLKHLPHYARIWKA